jgi:hypothetical protein
MRYLVDGFNLIIALVVYFLIVKPMNMLMARITPEAEGTRLALCPECFREISMEANRCPNGTTWLRGSSVAVS